MKIITFYNQKGGVGKTTLSLTVAHALKNRGYKVVIADSDGQRSISDILKNSNELNGIDFFSTDGLTEEYIEQIKNNYDYLLVDAKPLIDANILTGLVFSDITIVPTLLDQASFSATLMTMEYIKNIGNDIFRKTFIVINQVSHNINSKHRKFKEKLEEYLCNNFNVIADILRSTSYEIRQNYTVLNSKNKKYINDIEYLVDMILERINN